MTEDAVLYEKREELKRQITAGEYKTLADAILDGTGQFIQKLTRNPSPISFWYSAVVIGLVIALIASLTLLLLGEAFSLDLVLLGAWGIVMGIAPIALAKIAFDMVFTTWDEILIDAIESVENLDDLQSRCAAGFDVKKHLFFSSVLGFLFGFPILITWAIIKGFSIGVGVTIGSLAIWFLGGIGVSYLIDSMTLGGGLSRYQLKLYAANPSSSEVIDRLSDLFGDIALLGAMHFAIFTFGIIILFDLPLALVIYLALLSWGSLTAYFGYHQRALHKVIVRAKWKTLNKIQAKIERLAAQEDVPTKETLEHLGKLMDYHDQIKATRNSALDFRAGLKLLNSLLLPLIALLLSSLEKVIELFH